MTLIDLLLGRFRKTEDQPEFLDGLDNLYPGVTFLDPQRHEEVTAWVEKYPEQAAAEIMRLREKEDRDDG